MVVELAIRRDEEQGRELYGSPAVSVIIPAQNEAATIKSVISSVPVSALRSLGHDVEVVVVDNNSSDHTASLARGCRAIVVPELRPGYGRALRTGFEHARGAIIVISDGDATYPLEDLRSFLTPLLEGRADLVTGSRLRGRIHPGAMPALHRYVGVPVLTHMLNVLFGLGLSDGHCGLRAITRTALERMTLASDGMGFATEMLIRARHAGLRIVEIPIEYRPRPQQSVSKLRSFADGWQHLTLMVREYATLLLSQKQLTPSGLADAAVNRTRVP